MFASWLSLATGTCLARALEVDQQGRVPQSGSNEWLSGFGIYTPHSFTDTLAATFPLLSPFYPLFL